MFGKLIFVCIFSIIAMPVAAAVLCSNLNSSSTCSGGRSSGAFNWTIRCGTVDIKGVSSCASNAAKYGTVAETLAAGGVNCWCKMIYPGVSKWVAMGEYQDNTTTIANCLNTCAATCASKVVVDEDRNIKSSLFNNLEN